MEIRVTRFVTLAARRSLRAVGTRIDLRDVRLRRVGLTLLSAESYSALPREVAGVVDHVQGRTIWLQGGASYYLVLSDAELRSAQPWLRSGIPVTLWISPRGHVGSVAEDSSGGPPGN